jgi:hypothetical protein
VRRVRGAPLSRRAWPPEEGDHGYTDHRLLAEQGALTPEAYAQAVEQLGALLVAVDEGRTPPRRAWRAALDALAVGPGRASEPVPSERPAEVMNTAELAAIALDFVPEIGDDAPTALLGPWTAALSSSPLQRRAIVATIAAAMFAASPGAGRSALRCWSREKPRPSDHERASMLAVARAPFAPWSIGPEGAGWRLRPLLPMPPGWVPDQPVLLDEVGGVDGGPAPEALLFARVVRLASGWRVLAPLVLPELPPVTLIEAWYARSVDPERVENRTLTRLDGLRRHGHLICAEAHHWWWAARAGEEVPRRVV